ncbi:MAG TPA: 4Fe-4S dicluster domain-containing protein [Dehalococcoidia bacterium]|nr:4Fe-4S dicluster domain-containing protein [Dehalococcoidia bacterium]
MMSEQYGFYFDEVRCIQCRTCELACKTTRNVESGVSWRRVLDIWEGKFPDISRTFLSLACMHCERPACVEVCTVGAITKRSADGIVVIDKAICSGCRDCFAACPYDVPQFGKDGIMQKCDYCLEFGRVPACTESCPGEALFYGTLDDLMKKADENGKVVRRLDEPVGGSIIIVR